MLATPPEIVINKIHNIYNIVEIAMVPTLRQSTSSGVTALSRRLLLNGMCPKPVFPACF